MDFSQPILKAVLFHNGNNYISVPVVNANEMKKQYENTYFLMKYKYTQHSWHICGDLKVNALPFGYN
jgi:hypothetical protein